MKKILVLTSFLLAALSAFASHIVGGEMFYEYVSPGNAANTNRYKITLRLFRDDNCVAANCAQMPTVVWIGIYDNGTGQQFRDANPDGAFKATIKNMVSVPVDNNLPCIVNAPNVKYSMGIFELTVDLPINAKGYTAAYQTCCRINPMNNVFNTAATGSGTGSTYMCEIPGTDILGTAKPYYSSGQYATGMSLLCADRPFTLDFSIKASTERDSVVYVFCEAFNGGRATSAEDVNPTAPPYKSVTYLGGYSASSPLGSNVTIDPKTGIISGTAPGTGKYVVSVCAYEYREGKLINIHRKDFIVNIASCDFAGAQLDPSYTFCNSLTASFQNLNNSSLNKTYLWEFGDGNTSTEAAPTHTYADTGTYKIKLTVNPGEPCNSSTEAEVKVYPEFKADFSFAGGCVGKPTYFTDRTSTTYGQVATWAWTFESAGRNSSEQNPTHTFNTVGRKQVRLIVTSTKGCRDEIQKVVEITDKPFIDLRFRDTLICAGDRLQLEALGQGTFTWTPGTRIERENTATPIVFPTTTTTYAVRLDQDGCINNDSVRVRVVNEVTLSMPSDTTICATDSIQLRPVSDGLRFAWTPATLVSNPEILAPGAAPNTTTTFQLTATIGGCSATGETKVTVVPYPIADAGPDALICYDRTAQLTGTIDGNRFEWLPATLLQNAATLNPVTRRLTVSQLFVLAAYDNKGCPKPGLDTVLVQVLPAIQASAGRDTAVVIGQPLQLQASGGTSYQWTPSFGLSNPNIANPVVTFDGSQEEMRYYVSVGNDAGCVDTASIAIRIFKTDPRIFVPSAFTPDGDGRNDVFRPIAVGMTNIEFFRVFNRWGEKVFETTKNGQGWDGRIGGQLQPTGTYVWVVKGVDYTGKPFSAKGTVTLIR